MPINRDISTYVKQLAHIFTILLCVSAGLVALSDKTRASDMSESERAEFQKLFKDTTRESWNSTEFDIADLEKIIVRLLREYDSDGDGVEPDEFAVKKSWLAAKIYRDPIAEILSHDRNGDVIVTRQEILESIDLGFDRSNENVRRKMFNWLLRMDPNQDGKFERDELHSLILQGSDAENFRVETAKIELLTKLMAIDPNGDARLTVKDAFEIASGIFPKWQMPIRKEQKARSPEVKKQLAPLKADFRPIKIAEHCTAPPATPDAEVVVIGALQGGGFSTASLSANNRKTTVGTILIEPGASPVYLVILPITSMIWEIAGATERVQQALVTRATRRPSKDKTSSIGIVGIPESKVTMLPSGRCLYPFYATGSFDATRNQFLAEQLVGQPVLKTVGFQRLQSVLVPSGKHEKSRSTGRILQQVDMSYIDTVVEDIDVKFTDNDQVHISINNWRKWLWQRYPSGIVDVPVKQVISEGLAKNGGPIPALAAYFQLLHNGTWEAKGPDEIIARKAFQFPGGGGFHKLKLTLAKGVAEPEFFPRGLCIFSTDKNAFISGEECT